MHTKKLLLYHTVLVKTLSLPLTLTAMSLKSHMTTVPLDLMMHPKLLQQLRGITPSL